MASPSSVQNEWLDLTCPCTPCITAHQKEIASVHGLLTKSTFLAQCPTNGIHFLLPRSLATVLYELPTRNSYERKHAEVPYETSFPALAKPRIIGCRLRGKGFELCMEDYFHELGIVIRDSLPRYDEERTGILASLRYRSGYRHIVARIAEGLYAWQSAGKNLV